MEISHHPGLMPSLGGRWHTEGVMDEGVVSDGSEITLFHRIHNLNNYFDFEMLFNSS